MQDRYAGDIGDFAKFAILRGLLRDTGLRLGLAWYLTTQSGDPPGDGRHTAYLNRNKRNELLYRSCDAELFDCLDALVQSGTRSVGVFPTINVLPPNTAYFSTPLVLGNESIRERSSIRTGWVQQGLDKTAGCDIVMFDPDNGLEVQSSTKYSAKGTKYIFFDELAPYVARGQSVVVYQHANRSGSMSEQTMERLRQMRERLPLTAEPFAFVWRPVSTRAFLVAPAKNHVKALMLRAEALLTGPLGRHLKKYSEIASDNVS